jgi:hypothetical protein
LAVRCQGAERGRPDLHLDRHHLLLRLRRRERRLPNRSEILPIEIRAEDLAVFFAIAQIFGAIGPAFYGFLIGGGTNPANLAIGYLVGVCPTLALSVTRNECLGW